MSIDTLEAVEPPLVSVCVPVYNGMPYIVEAARSILGQTYENIEIIFSIDPSNDESASYLESLTSRNVKIIYNKNPGLFQNLNNAIRAASGHYVQVFCQDDVMLPGYIESQVARIRQCPGVVMALSRSKKVDSGGVSIGEDPNFYENLPVSPQLCMWRQAHYGSIASSISCIMIDREALDENAFFDEEYAVAGDVEYYIRVSLIGYIILNQGALFLNRAHAGQASRDRGSIIRYVREEGRINIKYWRPRLSDEQYGKVVRFRALTRGATHLKSCIRINVFNEPILVAKIVKEIVRTYGIMGPIRGVIKNYWNSEPELKVEDFQPEGRLGEYRMADACERSA